MYSVHDVIDFVDELNGIYCRYFNDCISYWSTTPRLYLYTVPYSYNNTIYLHCNRSKMMSNNNNNIYFFIFTLTTNQCKTLIRIFVSETKSDTLRCVKGYFKTLKILLYPYTHTHTHTYIILTTIVLQYIINRCNKLWNFTTTLNYKDTAGITGLNETDYASLY